MKQKELIKACKRNNLKAQMQVYLMYKDMLYSVSLRILKNEHDAQDAVHDAFIKAFQNISKVENELKLGAWLKRIVINGSLDFLRMKKKVRWLEDSMAFQQHEEGEDTELLEEEPLTIEDVKKALINLKDKYRIIIVLYLLEDYTHKEIAEQLGLKESTVRNQYARGKQLLKKQLQNKLVS